MKDFQSVCWVKKERKTIEAMTRKKWIFGSSQKQKEANLPKLINAVLPALHSCQSILGMKIRSDGKKMLKKSEK